MRVKDAKAVARAWVVEQGVRTPGFAGAIFHGSTAWLADDAPLPTTSDVDIIIVLRDADLPNKPGKFVYRGVLLEVSYISGDQLQSADQVLGQYHLAGSLRSPTVIVDPSGRLTELQAAVARDFAKRHWVRRRCEHARERILSGFRLNASDPFHDQVVAWLFPAGITTHVLLVAGLRNPTVRLRYLATRELLADYAYLDFYETLLDLLGCARLDRVRAEHHLATLGEAFDGAKAAIRTQFFFASDISDVGRPVAIDGSQALIARGYHREAMFWMAATYTRCVKVLHEDGTESARQRFDQGYRQLLADLGVATFDDLQRRRQQVESFVPAVWEVAEAIMGTNPGIDD